MARSGASASRRSAGRSSSSWDHEDRFATFLRESFSTLRREVPEAYAAMCGVLAPRGLRLHVDEERVLVRFTDDDARFAADEDACAVELRTDRRTILDVIDARRTLVGAVLADRLMMQGAPRDVLAFHDGLVAYVQGAVRARSFPDLLRRFRQRPRRQRRP